jgi:hypothetical protein
LGFGCLKDKSALSAAWKKQKPFREDGRIGLAGVKRLGQAAHRAERNAGYLKNRFGSVNKKGIGKNTT